MSKPEVPQNAKTAWIWWQRLRSQSFGLAAKVERQVEHLVPCVHVDRNGAVREHDALGGCRCVHLQARGVFSRAERVGSTRIEQGAVG